MQKRKNWVPWGGACAGHAPPRSANGNYILTCANFNLAESTLFSPQYFLTISKSTGCVWVVSLKARATPDETINTQLLSLFRKRTNTEFYSAATVTYNTADTTELSLKMYLIEILRSEKKCNMLLNW